MDQRHALKFDTETYTRTQALFATKREAFAPDSVTVLARDVISRLAEEKRQATTTSGNIVSMTIDPDMVDAFCDVLLGYDPAAPLRFLEQTLAPVVVRRSDLYEHIACASRRLGAKWDAEEVSYLQVTVAAGKLYALVRAVGSGTAQRELAHNRAKRALFASVPGEQHTLGVTIAAEMFRNAGWDITLMINQSHEELIDRAAAIHPPVIGLSISNSDGLDRLARLVVATRLTLANTVVAVAAGPEIDKSMLQSVVDLDLVITDAQTAQAEITKAMYACATG